MAAFDESRRSISANAHTSCTAGSQLLQINAVSVACCYVARRYRIRQLTDRRLIAALGRAPTSAPPKNH